VLVFNVLVDKLISAKALLTDSTIVLFIQFDALALLDAELSLQFLENRILLRIRDKLQPLFN
jgi:hypothetical protein